MQSSNFIHLRGIGALLLAIGLPHAPAAQAQGERRTQSACSAVWEMNVIVQDAKKSVDTLAIGQSASASDAVNTGCGEVETPPNPPVGIFGARFLFPDGKTYSDVDYRSNASSRVTWKLQLSGTHAFVITWDPADLPDGDFRLKDNINGGYVNVDMEAVSSFVLSDKTITELLIEKYAEGPCVDLDVMAGWNLLSIPVEAYDMRPPSLFLDKTARAFGYAAGYVSPAKVSTGKGYWIKFKAAGTYSVCGAYADGSIDVAIGWNLIGPHNQSRPAASVTKNPTTTILSSYYGYEGNTIVVTDSLEAGFGYWVNSNKVAVLTVGAGKTDLPPSPRPLLAQAEDPAWAILTLETATGSRQQLYVSKRPLTGDEQFTYELPPPAPEGAFDARFATGLQVAALFGGPATIALREAAYPLKVTVQNLPGEALYLTDGAGRSAFYAAAQEGRPALITEPFESIRVTLGTQQVGAESPEAAEGFALYPGYPNPFATTTTLRYELPEATPVRLRIFNALGQTVVSVEHALKPAGQHAYEFDARSLAAGLYYFTLEARGRRASRTLVLAR